MDPGHMKESESGGFEASLGSSHSDDHTSSSDSSDNGRGGRGGDRRVSSPRATMAVKLLVSNNMAGSIIGRSGQTIADLQQESGARIKLSQAGDCYPGTSERICLVQGEVKQVKLAVQLILQKLHETYQEQLESNSDRDGNHHNMKSNSRFNFSVRMLVPSQSCGMLIGRSGANINKIKEASGVSTIRISSKAPESSSDPSLLTESFAIATTSERTLTISSNDIASCQQCTDLILDEGASHPDIFRYVNMTTSYSKLKPLSQGPFITTQYGSQLLNSYNVIQPTSTTNTTANDKQTPQAVSTSSLTGNLQQLDLDRTIPTSNDEEYASSTDIQQQSQQKSAGFGAVSPSRDDVIQLPTTTITTSSLLAASTNQAATTSSTPQLIQPQTTTQQSNNNNRDQKQSYSVNIAVEDSLVGAILGRRGQTLTMLQSKSQTRIKVSQRGEFIPNTSNRIVTIRGFTPESIQIAQLLIQQQLSKSATGGRSTRGDGKGSKSQIGSSDGHDSKDTTNDTD